jgi:hypothetical protein
MGDQPDDVVDEILSSVEDIGKVYTSNSELAGFARNFYLELTEAGFDDEQALHLTGVWLQTHLNGAIAAYHNG